MYKAYKAYKAYNAGSPLLALGFRLIENGNTAAYNGSNRAGISTSSYEPNWK